MRTVHIMTATLTAGDAIGNYSRILQKLFWLLGFRVRIYADLWDEHSLCRHSRELEESLQPDDVLWFHYSIYSENVHCIPQVKNFTILDYHGVTPPELFHGYSSHLENLCIKARKFIPELLPHVDLAIAHSDYTLNELSGYGFPETVKIPLAVETSRFAVPELSSLSEYLKGIRYLLFVGRITPQKSIIELIHMFAALGADFPDLLLLLVGEYSYSPEYVQDIRDTIEEHKLEGRVVLTDKISHIGALKSLYKNALFSMYLSHWETFCVPLVESMHLGTPLVGLNKTAIPEILGDAGILIDNHDPDEFTRIIKPYLENSEIYNGLVDNALQRAQLFTEETLDHNIKSHVIPRIKKSGKHPRLAFVVQRYGDGVFGGAEHLCRLFAERLSSHLDVDVVTTCAVDYHTWADHYTPGTETINGVTVHRFPVDRERNMEEFVKESENLFEPEVHTISFEASMEWMRQQGPRSTRLLRFLDTRYEDYDFFVFFTYLYYTSVFGLPRVREKAILVPTAHNEPPIYLKVFRELFKSPRGLLYLTDAERDFVLRLYQNHHIPSVVTGVGIDVPTDTSEERFRSKYEISGPFLLYVGRIARSKGCQEMCDAFIEFKKTDSSPLLLVLVGKEKMDIPDHPDIRVLGFVPDQDKYDAMQAARSIINPSAFESLSFSILEAWKLKKPTLVNARCDVLADHTAVSGGGLVFTTEEEFIDAVKKLAKAGSELQDMGQRGYDYVQANYTWDRVEGVVLNFLSELHNRTFK